MAEATVSSADNIHDERVATLAANLASVRERVLAACEAAGRDSADVTLIAVTKTFPAADVCRLAALGVSDVGENRDQEAREKVEQVAAAGVPVRWHFVGRLQRNKARGVAAYAHLVHSVDRAGLAAALDTAAGHLGRRLDVLVQVSLDGDPARGGTPPEAVGVLADLIAGCAHLRLAGVMAVAPLGVDPDPAYARLSEVAATLRSVHPEARTVSAGMSDDLEAAIRHGATHVRVGTALLGGRAKLVR